MLVEGEKIVALGPRAADAAGSGVRTIDASGLQLLPGGIDPHVHLTAPYVDDFASGSMAALAGGITTLGVMAFADEGEALWPMLDRYARMVREQAIADVMLHPFLGNPPQTQELPKVFAAGHSSFKLITVESDFDAEFDEYVEALAAAADLGALPMIHCEDHWVLLEAQRKLVAERRTALEFYEASRPELSEVLAVQKVIALCELTGCPVYIVHLSTGRALRACEEARARGLPVYVETRPIYLHLTSEKYRTAEGPLYVGFPPLRSAEDRDALWRGLASGSIHTVGSDHAPWLERQKLDPKHDIRDPLAGMSNLQVMLPMLYSEGVTKQRIGVERFVELTATHAAKLLGVYPRKGVIQVGSDADIALWDPAARFTVRAGDDRSRADFSIYEGWSVTGSPRIVLRRGEIAFEDGRFGAAPGSGGLLARGRGMRI